MQITAQQISELVNGTIEGDPNVKIFGPSKIEEGKKGTISFLANNKYEAYAYTTKASALLVSNDFQASQKITATLIRVENVYASLAFLMEYFGQQIQVPKDISAQAYIHPKAKLANGVSVGAFTVIEAGAEIGEGAIIYPQVYISNGVSIGKNVILYAGVKIYHDCIIGDRSILHAGTIVGSDGFGFAPNEDGSFTKIPQLGNVIIEADVEIGANTVIDRATMGATIIKKGAKLDNLIQIAHNVEVGSNTVIAAQAGIAGSTKVGEQVRIGGQAGLVGHIHLADGTKVQAQSGVTSTIKKTNTALYGSPALSYRNYLKSYAVFRNLPDLLKRIQQLEKKLKDLE
ncbi:MAG TPA: UDP-3-O-(3-hydroxymyristoyl)glucosamine N-acyltransferase [Saprospiraceae bacterium]|nr:UDP-3-O-(3-hydroxymyristoyl)glucosamine N-acyltransferase [Saprospiraceae bacterium]